MCRHTYAANWLHNEEHCPNLVPLTKNELHHAKGAPTVPVNVRYSDKNVTHHKSLADLWNDWYSDWLDAEFPRLVVRYEDLLFHAEAVVGQICTCGGGVLHGKFTYIEDSAKLGSVHKGSNGLVKALISYGNTTRRTDVFRAPDLRYASKTLRKDILHTFRYNA